VQDGIKSQTIWKFNEVGHNQEASQELRKLFDGESYFDTPKPVRLLSRIIFLSTQKDDIVLDFFAGSSTTAHAVMQINAEDGCDRKFIMVQLPEQTDEKSDAYKAGYNTISEISKERIRRAGKKILEDNANKEGIENLDIGFRVLKIDTTNMKDVYYTPDALKQADILDLADHIKADRSSEDLLFQVMLDWGLELSLPIELKTVAGKEVFYVAGNSLVACFDDLTFDVVDEVAKDHPLRFVSAEKAIHLDHDKTNIKERFKQLSPDTEVKFL
jgi:adenine-specific DNA-methyltransferase